MKSWLDILKKGWESTKNNTFNRTAPLTHETLSNLGNGRH